MVMAMRFRFPEKKITPGKTLIFLDEIQECQEAITSLKFWAIDNRYDVIVSNPPYIASDVVDELMPEVQEHEPRMALDGGADGLDLYRRLLAQAPERLLSGGLLAVEIGYDQREAVMELFREQGFTDVYCDHDLCGNDRVVMGRYQ